MHNRKPARNRRTRWAWILLAAWPGALGALAGDPSGATGSRACAGDPAAPPRRLGKGILVDGIHANDLVTVGLEPEVYEYHQTTGCRRPFAYLRARGVCWDRVTEGQLDGAMLSKYRLLYLNLVSAERPPFLVSEIAAIRTFVFGGGSLFVVTDHSNCYFHTYRLRPLLTELDIASPTFTACDEPPHVVGGGKGWILVRSFKPHPVTAGLKCVALQTGGGVDPRFAVAMTSPQSWEDAWMAGMFGEGNTLGYCGNFRHDPQERKGPLGVVLARTLGHGRVVIIADSNMLGESYIHYADNYRLWLNALAWLLEDHRLGQPEPYQQWRSPRIVCYEQYDKPAFGTPDVHGSYNALTLMSRHWWTFANDRIEEPCELLVFALNEIELSPEATAAVAGHLRRGKNVLILNAESHSLEEQPGVIGQVLQAMKVARPIRHARPGKLVLAIPAAGAIHILGPDQVLDNGTLPPPTKAPNAAEKERCQALLSAVREALATN